MLHSCVAFSSLFFPPFFSWRFSLPLSLSLPFSFIVFLFLQTIVTSNKIFPFDVYRLFYTKESTNWRAQYKRDNLKENKTQKIHSNCSQYFCLVVFFFQEIHKVSINRIDFEKSQFFVSTFFFQFLLWKSYTTHLSFDSGINMSLVLRDHQFYDAWIVYAREWEQNRIFLCEKKRKQQRETNRTSWLWCCVVCA